MQLSNLIGASALVLSLNADAANEVYGYLKDLTANHPDSTMVGFTVWTHPDPSQGTPLVGVCGSAAYYFNPGLSNYRENYATLLGAIVSRLRVRIGVASCNGNQNMVQYTAIDIP